MASAYSAIPNGGDREPAYSSIESRIAGDVIYEHQPNGSQAVSQLSAHTPRRSCKRT
jgi:hypothetical protein